MAATVGMPFFAGYCNVTPDVRTAKIISAARATTFGRKSLSGNASVVFTAYDRGNSPLYHVVQDAERPDGYVIVSGDTDTPRVFGWVENAAFNESDIPADMKWWLSELSAKAPRNKKERSTQEEWENIEPLVEARWNQDAPYFNNTPTILGKHCWTGCGATAMAQIFYHHKWPESASGTGFNYIYGSDVDLTPYKFDWESMLPEYKEGEYDETQAAAVADLMTACGYSVRMQYSTSVSLCASSQLQRAVIENFNYGPDVKMLYRDYMNDPDFISTIYCDIKDGLPVLFGGVSTGGGHAFVVDGYADGYFHINWGWSGQYDGYFLLDNLNPEGQGIGGYEGGYNSSQHAITGIRPNREGENSYFLSMLSKGSFSEYVKGDWVYYDGSSYSLVYNSSNYIVEVTPAIKILSLDNADAEPVYVLSSDGSGKYGIGEGFRFIQAKLPADLPDGAYSISGCLIDAGGKECPIFVRKGKRANVTARVKEGKAKIYNQSTLPEESGIDEMSVAEESDAEYFDLNGRRVTSPYKGNLYIVKKGSRYEKIIAM